MTYQGVYGATYYIDENKISGGGEGSIHSIRGNDFQVAKIFKINKRDSQRESKLRLMIKEKLTSGQLAQITWPQDVIYDKDGFAGYIMPKLKNTSSLTELYSSEEYDLRYRLMAAANLCAAVDTVHEMWQVCGDLNPRNICVNLNREDEQNAFSITLVDTDSYHFTSEGVTYRCEVGLGDFIAPELQRKLRDRDLRTIPLPSYTKETDLFALAVHIFYLLMNGCHPFACAKEQEPNRSNIPQMGYGAVQDSIVAPQPVENIVNGFFPFCQSLTGIVIPVYAPRFEALPYKIREMFVETFVNGYAEPSKRVSAKEWQEVLLSMRGSIVQCNSCAGHYYFDNAGSCPLCEIIKREEELFGSLSLPWDEKDGKDIISSETSSKSKKAKNKKSKKRWIGIILVWMAVLGMFAEKYAQRELSRNHKEYNGENREEIEQKASDMPGAESGLSLEEYVSIHREEIEQFKSESEEEGMIVDVYVNGNSLIYSYQFPSDIGDVEQAKASLEQVMEQEASSVEMLLSELRGECSGVESIIVEFLDMYGNVIYSRCLRE